MLLSVIIPHYNNVVLLGRCLHSLAAAQLGDDLQMVVVDDGSSEEQFRQVEAFVAHSGNITLLRNTSNQGASFSRNRGLLSAKGRFVWFVDSDDEVDSRALRLWWPHLKAVDDNVDLLHLGPMVQAPVERVEEPCAWQPRPSSQAPVERGTPASPPAVISASSILQFPNCLDHTTYWIDRDMLMNNPELRYPENVEILEDSIFVLHLLDNAKHIVVAHDCCPYIRHKDSHSVTAGAWSREKSARFLPCILSLFTCFSAFLEKQNQALKQSNTQALKQSNTQAIKQSNNQAIKQSNNQAIKQSNNQAIKQSPRYHRYCYVYMRVLAVKGIPKDLYRELFYNPVIREGFIPHNLKERLLKNTFVHSLLSLLCRLLRSSRN